MDGTNIALWLFKVLSPVLLAVVTWLGAKSAQWLSARIKNEYLRSVLVRLDDAVVSVVRELHQVTVDALKASSPDGKLTAGTRETVKRAALDAIKSHLGVGGLNEVARVLGLKTDAVDRLINTKIEAAVHDIKTQQKVMNGVNHPASIPVDIVPFPT